MIRRIFRLPPKHRHTWEYGRRTGTGWGIVRCTTCTYYDLY